MFVPSRLSGRRARAHPTPFPLLAVALAVATLHAAGIAAPAVAQDPGVSPAASAPVQPPSGAAADIAFPSTLAGSPLDVRSYTGEEWLAANDSGTPADTAWADEMRTLLQSMGRDTGDMTVKSSLAQPSEGNQAVITAVRIEGTEARTWISDMVRVLVADIEEPALVMRQPLPGRWVLRVVDAATPGVYPRTVYIEGDTAWIVGADESWVLELLDQLPAVGRPAATDSGLLAGQLPLELGGQRRAGLYESVEPLFLPTLSQSLGASFEDWLLDLYLDEAVSPTSMIGAVAWWGLQSSDEGVEVEGYYVPGASPEMLERLLREVVLAGGQTLEGELGRTEEEIGGRTVTTIDRGGGARKHIFASDGTLWVVNDHAGQPELAAEAVAALP